MTSGATDPSEIGGGAPERSPWAPGGPSESEFARRLPDPVTPPGHDPSSPIVFDTPSDLGSHEFPRPDLEDDARPDARERSTRRTGLIVTVAVVAVTGLAVGATALIPDTDLDGEVTATGDSAGEISETSDPQVGPPGDDEAGGETLPRPDDAGGVAEGESNGPRVGGIPLRVDVPPFLASSSTPTEIVALTDDGLHVTVSLPSGAVRVAPVEIEQPPSETFFSSALLATPSFSLFNDNADLVLVDRAGDVTRIDRSEAFPQSASVQRPFPLGWAARDDGTDVAVLAVTDEFGLQPTNVAVAVDGTVTAADLGASATLFEPVPAVFDDGAVVTEDGGLIVRRATLDQPGVAIGRGELLAGGAAGSVVRRCDEPDACTVALVDELGQPTATVAPDVVDAVRIRFFGGPFLSPTGEHVLVRGSTGDLPPNQAWILAIRLADGDVTPIEGLSDAFSGEFPSWIADGSAVVGRPSGGNGSDPFPDDPGVEVVPLDPDIEPFRFAEEIGGVLSLTTRFPAAELPVQAPVSTVALEGVPLAAVNLPPVVVADTVGQVSRIDFASGEVTRWSSPLPTGWATGNGAQVIQRDRSGAVVDEGTDDIPSEVVLIDGLGDDSISIVGDEIVSPPDWPAGPRYPYNLKLIWAPIPGADGDPVTYGLVDHQSITRSVIQVPAGSVMGDDGGGGLIHELAGDVWVSDFDSTIRVTTGDLWATNADTSLAWECDADLVCDTRVIDRTTGERRGVGLQLGALAIGAAPGRDVTLSGTLSPDARWALVELSEPVADDVGAPWGFLDLETSVIVPTAEPDALHPVIWSDDGSVALFVSRRRLHMLDTAANTIVGGDAGLGGFASLAAMGPVPS